MVTIDEGFNRLRRRIHPLGPHLERFFLVAERRLQDLLQRLEEAGLRHRVWLWDMAQDLPAEMDVVVRVGRDLEQKLSFLGTYHALQLIHLNLSLLDGHALYVTRSPSPRPAMRQFLRASAQGFRRLVTAYMERLFALLLPADQAPGYALLNAGSLWDRDDLDVLVVDGGGDRCENLRRAVARLATEMLRYATRLDFHAAEEVGGNRYSAGVAEYTSFLRQAPWDFVSATEMLSAELLLGSPELFAEFRDSVRPLFFCHHGRPGPGHEAYLRGTLGEVAVLATTPVDEVVIRPKQDAIRPIKGVLTCLRVIHGLEESDPLLALEALRQREPERARLYTDLEEHLLFFETFRQLYHFFVGEAEEIHLGLEIPAEGRRRIAALMAYEATATVDAWDGLIFRYHQRLRRARQLVLKLAEMCKGHLKRVTVFAPFLAAAQGPEGLPPRQLLARAIRAGRSFPGAGYWDDLLDSLEESPRLLEVLVESVLALPERSRRNLLRRLASGVHRTTRGLMRLVRQVHSFQHRPGVDGLLRELVAGLLDELAAETDLAQRLVHVFLLDSKRVCDFLGALTEGEQQRVAAILRGIEEESGEAVSDEAARMRRLCRLFYSHSRYFQRFFLRVVERHPYVVPHLTDMESLDQIVRGLGAFRPDQDSFQDRRQALGDSFDIEVVRLGLTTLTSPQRTRRGEVFGQLFGPYLNSLIRVCRQEAIAEAGAYELADADMAVFLTGGAARGDAFAEDVDLFGVCAQEEEIPFFTRVLGRVAKELGQRGLMADFCLAGAVGGSVCTLDRIVAFMAGQAEPPLVESSLLLGSRLAEGGERFRRRLVERVLRPFLFNRSTGYIRGMAAQVEAIEGDRSGRYDLDVKEGPGGLRVQEMVVLMLQAFGHIHRREEAVAEGAFAQRWPEIRPALQDLARAQAFFRDFRDVYWVTVSATTTIDPDFLHRPAQILGIQGRNPAERGRRLLEHYSQERERSSRACLEVTRWLLAQVAAP